MRLSKSGRTAILCVGMDSTHQPLNYRGTGDVFSQSSHDVHFAKEDSDGQVIIASSKSIQNSRIFGLASVNDKLIRFPTPKGFFGYP